MAAGAVAADGELLLLVELQLHPGAAALRSFVPRVPPRRSPRTPPERA
jgi:hypothetical protein